jgi:hypothetical protein
MTSDLEEEDIAMLLALHANKRSKHGGSVFGRQKLQRERIKGHNKLMRSYFLMIQYIQKVIFGGVSE